MSVKVDAALTRKVAELARLELSPEEVQTFTAQIAEVLAYVDQLGEAQVAEVESVEPLAHPLQLETPLREDKVRPSPVDEQGSPKILQCAPEVVDQGFKVPSIL